MNWALFLLGGWLAFCLLAVVLMWVRAWRNRGHVPVLVYDHRCNGRPYSVDDVRHDCQASTQASRARRGV